MLSFALAFLLFVQQSSIPPQPPAAPAIDEIIFKGFPFARNMTRADAERVLGQPVSAAEKQEENRHLSTLRFPGLVLELYEQGGANRGTISSIELSDNRWHFPAKLRIGSTRDEMLKLLGKPDIENPSEAIYGCYDCVYDDKIHFMFEGKKIKSMKWDFYLD